MIPEQLDLDWTTEGPSALVEHLAPISREVEAASVNAVFHTVERIHSRRERPDDRRPLFAPKRPDHSADPLPLAQQWADGKGAVGEWAAAERARRTETNRTAKREHARRADALRPAAEAEWAVARQLVTDWQESASTYIASVIDWSSAPRTQHTGVVVEPLRMPVTLT